MAPTEMSEGTEGSLAHTPDVQILNRKSFNELLYDYQSQQNAPHPSSTQRLLIAVSETVTEADQQQFIDALDVFCVIAWNFNFR
jgi:hypothetical protein